MKRPKLSRGQKKYLRRLKNRLRQELVPEEEIKRIIQEEIMKMLGKVEVEKLEATEKSQVGPQ